MPGKGVFIPEKGFGMRYALVKLSDVCCQMSGPARRVPIEQGRLFYNRNMTDRERVQSVQPGADMAVPLFSVFLGGAVLC